MCAKSDYLAPLLLRFVGPVSLRPPAWLGYAAPPINRSGTACQPALRTRSAVLLSCGRSPQSRTVCEADRRPLNGERAPCQAASEAAAEPPVAEPGKTGVQGARGSPLKGGPDRGAHSPNVRGEVLAQMKPRRVGAVWI